MATTPNKNKANSSTRPKSVGPTRGRSTPVEREASPFSIAGIRGGALSHVSVKVVMFSLILIFAVGFLITSFNPTAGLGGKGPMNPQQRFASTEAVARVGNDTIERGRFETIAARQDQMMEQFGQHTGPLEYLGSRQRTLQSLTDNAALVQAARDADITISNEDIDAEMKKRIEEQIESEQKQTGEANFRRQVEAQYGSMEAYRSELQQLASKERDSMERSLLVEKFEKKIKDENKVGEDDYKRSQTKIKLRQIVIRPKVAGFADKAAQEKNKAEAKTKAEKLATALKKKPTPQYFYTVAKKESEDLMTKNKGGEVGWKLPAELALAPDLRDAVVKANGKIVGPIGEESSGDQYIFLVEARALRLPKDFAKNKKKLLKDFEEQQDNEAWQKYQQKVSKAATVDVLDPALQAYKIQTEQIYTATGDEQKKLREEALQKYESALGSTSGMEAAAIRYQMAQLYRDTQQPKKAAEVLKAATEDVNNVPALKLEYARALRDSGDKAGALKQLQGVSKDLDIAPPAPPSMFGGNPNDALRYQIASEFEALNKRGLAAKERAKVKPAAPGGMGMPGMSLGGGGNITIPPRR